MTTLHSTFRCPVALVAAAGHDSTTLEAYLPRHRQSVIAAELGLSAAAFDIIRYASAPMR